MFDYRVLQVWDRLVLDGRFSITKCAAAVKKKNKPRKEEKNLGMMMRGISSRVQDRAFRLDHQHSLNVAAPTAARRNHVAFQHANEWPSHSFSSLHAGISLTIPRSPPIVWSFPSSLPLHPPFAAARANRT